MGPLLDAGSTPASSTNKLTKTMLSREIINNVTPIELPDGKLEASVFFQVKIFLFGIRIWKTQTNKTVCMDKINTSKRKKGPGFDIPEPV
jgi:hypothetical protein